MLFVCPSIQIFLACFADIVVILVVAVAVDVTVVRLVCRMLGLYFFLISDGLYWKPAKRNYLVEIAGFVIVLGVVVVMVGGVVEVRMVMVVVVVGNLLRLVLSEHHTVGGEGVSSERVPVHMSSSDVTAMLSPEKAPV